MDDVENYECPRMEGWDTPSPGRRGQLSRRLKSEVLNCSRKIASKKGLAKLEMSTAFNILGKSQEMTTEVASGFDTAESTLARMSLAEGWMKVWLEWVGMKIDERRRRKHNGNEGFCWRDTLQHSDRSHLLTPHMRSPAVLQCGVGLQCLSRAPAWLML